MKPFLIWYLYSGLMIFSAQLPAQLSKDSPQSATAEKTATLCANMSETSIPSTITVGRGKKSHLEKHEQVRFFFRCVGSFGA